MEQQKVFSLSEVSLHSSNKDCWVILHGKVYDVTQFLDEHPGGEGVLIRTSADGDATDAFEDVGHSSMARSMMDTYLIGVLEGSDPNAVGGYPQSLRTKGKMPSSASGILLYLLKPLSPLLVMGMAWTTWYLASMGKMKPHSP